MRVKYIGNSFGVTGLTSGKEYECLGVEPPFLRIVDDEDEDYLYPIANPGPMTMPGWESQWEIVNDNDGILRAALKKAT